MEDKEQLIEENEEDIYFEASEEALLEDKFEILDENSQENNDLQVINELSHESEEELIKKANEYKFDGNELFRQTFFDAAIISYQKALNISPPNAKHERAIYHANIAECYIRKKLWNQAVDACTQALEEDPEYIKALHRRAKANEEIDTWRSLDDALLDYEKIQKYLPVTSPFLKSIRESISRVKPKLSEAQEREKAEMLKKLKNLGNNILGKFGLSTDNFKVIQDPKTGGYSISFQK